MRSCPRNAGCCVSIATSRDSREMSSGATSRGCDAGCGWTTIRCPGFWSGGTRFGGRSAIERRPPMADPSAELGAPACHIKHTPLMRKAASAVRSLLTKMGFWQSLTDNERRILEEWLLHAGYQTGRGRVTAYQKTLQYALGLSKDGIRKIEERLCDLGYGRRHQWREKSPRGHRRGIWLSPPLTLLLKLRQLSHPNRETFWRYLIAGLPYDPPPHHFDPDDKRSYLLMVFTRTSFVPFAVPAKGGLKMYPFPREPGIYALYLNRRPLSEVLSPRERKEALTNEALSRLTLELVYVGKTSGGGTLRDRLRVHYRKIDSRLNVSVDQIVCRHLQIKYDWNVLFSERHLIEAPEIVDNPPPRWNTIGFGSNPPGRGRPGYRPLPATHFDVLYPKRAGAPAEEPDEEEA